MDTRLTVQYLKIIMPIAAKMTEHEKLELSKFLITADGGKPAYYRMAEFWYSNMETMQESMNSPEGQATAGNLSNFATGGVSLLVGEVEYYRKSKGINYNHQTNINTNYI